ARGLSDLCADPKTRLGRGAGAPRRSHLSFAGSRRNARLSGEGRVPAPVRAGGGSGKGRGFFLSASRRVPQPAAASSPIASAYAALAAGKDMLARGDADGAIAYFRAALTTDRASPA